MPSLAVPICEDLTLFYFCIDSNIPFFFLDTNTRVNNNSEHSEHLPCAEHRSACFTFNSFALHSILADKILTIAL